VPVNFRALRHPKIDMVWVALAGPGTNIALALAAALAFHGVGYLPASAAQWVADNLQNAIGHQCRAGGFQHAADPAADGGRVAVGLLSRALGAPLARLEPFGC